MKRKYDTMRMLDCTSANEGGKAMAECSNTSFSTNQRIGVAMEGWLYRYKQYNVKDSSFRRLVASYKLLRQYQISNVLVGEATSDDIQSFVNRLNSDRYSISTIRKAYNLITSFFRFLIGEKVPVSPVYINVSLPNEDNVHYQKHDVSAYSIAEQKRLLSVCEGSTDIGARAIIVLMGTGLRIGELLALQWSDVDWGKRAIYVHRTLVHLESRKRCFLQDSPKSKSSRRYVPLNTKVMNVFRDLAETAPGLDGFVFSTEDDPNVSLAYNPLARLAQQICETAGVQWKGFHALRHTFATNCYYKGCDIKILSKLLGHASVTITYNTYINLYGDALEEMRSVVE